MSKTRRVQSKKISRGARTRVRGIDIGCWQDRVGLVRKGTCKVTYFVMSISMRHFNIGKLSQPDWPEKTNKQDPTNVQGKDL